MEANLNMATLDVCSIKIVHTFESGVLVVFFDVVQAFGGAPTKQALKSISLQARSGMMIMSSGGQVSSKACSIEFETLVGRCA